MLTVSELFIYPVKSLGGIQVSSALVTDRGLQHDRRWMVVDENGHFLTQREYPQMALLKVAITGESLVIENTSQRSSPLVTPLKPDFHQRHVQQVQVWSDRCKAVRINHTADEWLSDALAIRCRLVYMPDQTRRLVDSRYARNKEITNFSDGYPFLMIGQASLDELNSRLPVALPINRFRPNIVFSGGAPHEEDRMEHFSIGGLDFFGVKRSARCVITTIDQQTAIMGKEPLKTLATYRKKNNNIYFGQNLLSQGEGLIHIGDVIDVKKRILPDICI